MPYDVRIIVSVDVIDIGGDSPWENHFFTVGKRLLKVS